MLKMTHNFQLCCCLSICLSICLSVAVVVRLVEAVGFGGLQSFHLLNGRLTVSGLLFPQQVSAVEKQVTWQQEAGERENQKAKVDLKHRRGDR